MIILIQNTIYLQGKSHRVAFDQMQKLYLPMLTANLKYLTLLQFINIKYIPPMVIYNEYFVSPDIFILLRVVAFYLHGIVYQVFIFSDVHKYSHY